jgi:hypothetical protein
MFTPSLLPQKDPVWDSVLGALSSQGRLSRFYKLPRTELKAVARLWGKKTVLDLAKMFQLTQEGKLEEREAWLATLTEGRVFAMFLHLGRLMKCWIETELDSKNSRWPIANA